MFYKPFLGAVNTGMSIDVYTMLCDGEWWVCQKDGWQLRHYGEKYRKICEVDYIGYEGARVLGIFRINHLKNLAPYKYDFVFVSDDLVAGHRLKKCVPE